MKVALVQPGVPLEIVTNTISKRKTEIVIGFDRGERFFGPDAANMLSRRPKQAFTNFIQMLGAAKPQRAPQHHPQQSQKALLDTFSIFSCAAYLIYFIFQSLVPCRKWKLPSCTTPWPPSSSFQWR